ncbi:hypothetical protein Acr_00g0047930 [Actinidia rufa]|uniref:Uncharacterized protein n=1 Tax=Actinidia rufa TaxID=165716 RepID=A0A7J0DLT3_9ERIC|nr:hypothetical protein Acr_00g0047930 [Actinidia rufa]
MNLQVSSALYSPAEDLYSFVAKSKLESLALELHSLELADVEPYLKQKKHTEILSAIDSLIASSSVLFANNFSSSGVMMPLATDAAMSSSSITEPLVMRGPF